VQGTTRRSVGGGRTTLRGFTTDAWYTLIYLSDAERRALEIRRRRIWSAPLLRAGLARPEVDRLLARRETWLRAEEARGRTPAVPAQVRRLAAWSGRRVAAETLPADLDLTLLRAEVRVAPGAGEALRRLTDVGVRLGVVSNVLNESGHVARTILDRLGLLPRFQAVYLSCEHTHSKPSPAPFTTVCRFLGVRPQAAVHLGDLAYDLRGAGRAGMDAWWYVGLHRLNRYLPGQVDPRTVPATHVVRSWSQVPARLVRRA
jgi:FMN phosphatase YigB (HAD superfamily)